MALVLLFLVHALTYLYFFVDDEAITLVFARNLLRGAGLSYAASDGPVEGYSNFLHVLLSAGFLLIARTVTQHPLAVFVVGKAFSLACGAGIVALVWRMLGRLPEVTPFARVGATLLLALAGPLALWSNSMLETVAFALLCTLLVSSLLRASEEPVPRMAAIWACALVLMRVDGFLYLAVFVGSAFLWFGRGRGLLRRVVWPSLAVMVLYQAWRLWYFDEALPLPVYTKILYKLQPHLTIVQHKPALGYVERFSLLYGAVPLALAMLGHVLWPADDAAARRRARFVLTCALALGAYVGVVGDWMFGFRLFVALLPLVALLTAFTLSRLDAASLVVGRVAAVAAIAWICVTSASFYKDYTNFGVLGDRRGWWAHPTLDPRLFFAPYYDLYLDLRAHVRPGDLTANNQAGLVPYLLDVENIDDLGLCSPFFATLPTRDVIFTEVGRYQPLTNEALTSGHAYLLHREPRFIIGRRHLMQSANGGRVPEEILGGAYRRFFTDSAGENVVYERTAVSVAEYKRDGRRFLENLAHVANVEDASVNGRAVPLDELEAQVPHLKGTRGTVRAAPQYELLLRMADEHPIYEVYLQTVSTSHPVQVEVKLQAANGGRTYAETFTTDPANQRSLHVRFAKPVRARSVGLRIVSTGASGATVDLDDFRVLGQTDALVRHLDEHLEREDGTSQVIR